jgi:hypothetical protein
LSKLLCAASCRLTAVQPIATDRPLTSANVAVFQSGHLPDLLVACGTPLALNEL